MKPTGTLTDRESHAEHEARRLEALHALKILEYAVNLFDGVYRSGEGHAPLLYAGDPRRDVPSQLRRHLTETLRDRDGTIVKGWLEGIAEGGAEDLGLE